MNENSIKLAKEICDKNFDLVIIEGCSDPTYASDVFFYCFDNIKKISMGLYVEISNESSLLDWLINTIEDKIHPDYEIFKVPNFKDLFVISEENNYYLNNNNTVSVDFGGYIRLINIK